MKQTLRAYGLAFGWIVLAAVTAAAAPSGAEPSVSVEAQVQADHTLLTLIPSATAGAEAYGDTVVQLVALPRGVTGCTAEITAGTPGAVSLPGGVMTLRGQPLIAVRIAALGAQTVEVALQHGGGSPIVDRERLYSPALAAVTGALPGAVVEPTSMGGPGGSYVIITAPHYLEAIQPLVDWKQRKGYPVRVATTEETGISSADIKAWLQDAYDTWATPPEYVLLFGDVDDLPTWQFFGNVSDLPYALLDGDDWLPDVMVGRMSIATGLEADTIVSKSVSYERTPDLSDGDEWFTRMLGVAGNYGSSTPTSTVDFCGEQMQTLGFEPAAQVYFPPYWNGIAQVTEAIDAGVSLVVYRGWAYGTNGWEPPHFTVSEIPGLSNGGKLPVVMSFVCLNGDYGASSPCFGEVWLRTGSPTTPRGGVAFIGNGEHWSHTRFNDAMAIAFFERIVTEEVTDLGSLMTSGKLRFLEYFPNELEAGEPGAEGALGEESVEFYFHIYNLLGDPELNFWKSAPAQLAATHADQLPVGSNYLEVSVTDAFDAPLTGARVGVTQNESLLGCQLTDADGLARIPLETVQAGSEVAVTVTSAGHAPYEGIVTTDGNSAYVAVTETALDDSNTPPAQGNGDGLVNPGESVAVTPTFTNAGAVSSGSGTATLTVTGPATAVDDAVPFGDIPPAGDAAATVPFVLAVDPAAADGSNLLCQIDAERSGGAHDLSQFQLMVAAPALQIATLTISDDGVADPGESVELALVLQNTGSASTGGGEVAVTLDQTDAATLTGGPLTFGPLSSGGSGNADATLELQVNESTAVGSGLTLRLAFTTDEGYTSESSYGLVVGEVGPDAPVGPDTYGYYAYDSADIAYPDGRPAYQWHELSTEFGGVGDRIYFPANPNYPDSTQIDNYHVAFVELPFTFTYYGAEFDSVRVSDNGWIAFDDSDFYDFYNFPMPSEHGVNGLVAPFWDNLTPEETGPDEDPTGGVESDGVYTHYDADAGVFTVEWSRMRHYRPENADVQTFQVQLLDPAMYPTPTGDGEIVYLYKQVVNGDNLRMFATVGLESPDGRDGLQLTYDNLYNEGMAPLGPGLAVKLTTSTPVHVPYRLALFGAEPTGGDWQLSWQPADDRPVLGWRIHRLTDGGREELTTTVLPGSARSYVVTGNLAGDDDDVVFEALHPYGSRSELGPFALASDGATQFSFALHPCVPNPARGGTSIAYTVPRSGAVRLRVYDLAGRLVRTLLDGPVSAGHGNAVWDGRNDRGHQAADGVYLYRLEAGPQQLTRKLLLVR